MFEKGHQPQFRRFMVL